MSSRRGRMLRVVGVTLTAFAMAVALAFPAAAAELMRVTFVRHAQSAGNASGLIDTKTPGPDITALGQQQAQAVVGKLGYNNYDAIYASQMVRTQQTAAPLADYLRLPVTVLPGIQEIEAGVFEGTPESQAAAGYGRVLAGWALGGAQGMGVTMPGTTLNGYGFDARVDQAMQTIYDNGDRNAVVFSHGGAIMFWTMINAQNLTTAQKLALLQTAPLNNTDYVVVEGNNEDGWTLVNWNGQQFSPDRTLAAEVKVQLRTLGRQLQTTAGKVAAAIASMDFQAIVKAVAQGISDAAYSAVKFGRAVAAKVTAEIKAHQSTATEEPATEVATATLARSAAVPAAASTAVAEKSESSADETATATGTSGDQVTGSAAKSAAKLPAVKDEDAAKEADTAKEAEEAAAKEAEDAAAKEAAESAAKDAADEKADAAKSESTPSDTGGSDTVKSDTAGSDTAESSSADSGASRDAA